MLKSVPTGRAFRDRRRADADGRFAVLNTDRVESATPVVGTEAQVRNRARRSQRAKRGEMAPHARDEAGRDRAEPTGAVRIECAGRAVRVPHAQVEVTAVSDGVGGRLGRERRPQATLASGLPDHLPGHHHAIRSRDANRGPTAHFELSHSELGLECLEPDTGIEKRRGAEIRKRCDAANRVEGER